MSPIELAISEEFKMEGILSNSAKSINGTLSKIGQALTGIISKDAAISYYDGEYEITPKVEAQSLPTKNKVMSDDVMVQKIPFFETSNTYGETVYIASEV